MAERVVIIGAGQAGVQAVTSLRGEGFAGAITLVGEESYPPYQRPPLSKAYLAGDLTRERLFLKPATFFTETDCVLRLGVTAVRIDRAAKSVRLNHGHDLVFDKLLLTTGARVRRLPVPGADLPGIHYLRGIDDVDALRPGLNPGTRLVVVGGGYIGLEVAAVAAKHGLDVTIVEAASRVMERAVSPLLSKFYAGEHRAHGVKLLLDAKALGFEGDTRVEAVTTDKGRVPADAVLVGIGVVPNSEIAEAAGLVCDNGIVVDEFARTSDASILAAGDCTNHPAFAGGRSRLESVQNAIDQAKHAAMTLVGRGQAYREVPWFWSDQYDLKLQMAGLARRGDETVLRGDPKARKFAIFHLRDGAVAAVEAVNAAPEYVVGRKLIAEGKKIAPERLADLALPMKSFV